jgi:hypothetical protein
LEIILDVLGNQIRDLLADFFSSIFTIVRYKTGILMAFLRRTFVDPSVVLRALLREYRRIALCFPKDRRLNME